MVRTSRSRRTGVSRSLLADLHGFLALEAPFLLTELRAARSAAELEERLIGKLDELAQAEANLPAETLFPGTSSADALAWTRAALEEQIRGFFARRRIRASISAEERRLMFRTMLLTRAVDEHLKQAFDSKEVRWQGFPSPQKGFRSTGQEAIVGAALRLRRPPESAPGPDYSGDYVSPLIRDLGVLMMFMPEPLHPILVQYGKTGTPVGGRDIHVGDFEHGVMPPAAPLAIATQTLIGLAYANKLAKEDRVCVSFIGDGGSSLGEWHEAVNFAAVQKLGMVFVVENNHWALGTHVSEQTATKRFALRAAGYGIPGITVFGNDPDEVAAAVGWAAERARQGKGPSLVELVTYRRPGHAHHDDDRFHGNPDVGVSGYEFEEERAAWEPADPIEMYQERLIRLGILDDAEAKHMRASAAAEVAAAVEIAEKAPWPEPSEYRQRVYAPRTLPVPAPPAEPKTKSMAYDEAVRDALNVVMEEDEKVFVLGEDVGGRYGGAFGVTRGLVKRFGAERCLNTPLAESAIVGCGVGAALAGYRPVVEMQFADFLAPAFNALVNNAAKIYWRWGHPVPLVVRLPYGGATGTAEKLLGGGPYHSQCPEMWFVRIPGWKVVAPAGPADAKGLMLAAVRDDNPVIFLEAKGLYGFFRTDLREDVPLGPAPEIEIGKAAVRRSGEDLTVITYGAMVWTALAAAEDLARGGVSAEVIDLRSLVPLDTETIRESVAKTNHVLLLHEDTRRGGFGGELAAYLADELFFHLDAPIRRVTAPNTPIPYAPPLELDFLPKSADVVSAARELLKV